MSVMGFQKKVWMGGWGELYPSFFWIFGIFLTLQSPLVCSLGTHPDSYQIDVINYSK